MKLRRPLDTLAGCVWLPRFIDKIRHHLNGTLDPEFVRPFCHPLATDGAFLAHFELSKDEVITAVEASNGDDRLVEAWFCARPQATTDRIQSWNTLAPNIGKEGFPQRRGFMWIMKHTYGGAAPDPRVDSAFTAIAYDEGYLDEVSSPNCGADAANSSPAAATRSSPSAATVVPIARVVEILIAASPAEPVVAVPHATAVPGVGLEGDRYARGVGTFSRHPQVPDGELTLVQLEHIQDFATTSGVTFTARDARRNLVTVGVDLNALVGCDVRIGEVLIRGLRLCEPCNYLAKQTRPQVLKGLVHKGGLRAQILTPGVIRVNDAIVVLPPPRTGNTPGPQVGPGAST